MKNEITQQEIIDLMLHKGLTMEKFIDAIIDVNKIIGVGLITLGETMNIYCRNNKELRREGITKEEITTIFYKAMRHQNKN